jgi:glyoxylase-like metal-dependent hydrolase (beta-lactamase superfamily II)
MSNLVVEHLVVGPLQSNCFILGHEPSGEAVVIDPGGDGDIVMAAVRRRPWKIVAVLNTHAHFDHTGANDLIVRETGAPLMIPKGDAPHLDQAHMAANIYGLRAEQSPKADRLLDEGDVIPLGDEDIRVLSTPGHTIGGASFLTSAGIFTGDALFAGSIGRTDLPGGDYDILINSIREKILSLPDETLVYPGHGPSTEVGREKTENLFFQE